MKAKNTIFKNGLNMKKGIILLQITPQAIRQPQRNNNMSKILRLLNIGENTSLNNRLPLVAGMMDNRDLSKTIVSGQASRYSLAFFVPKFWLASQASQDNSTTHHPKSIGVNRHIMPALAAVYDGVTLQNKRKPICRAVTVCTEIEPRHPMTFHSVVLTQKQIGVA